jgi:hypothetical protein
MAITVMGGLFVATLLTLLVVPALYAIWFRVRIDQPAEEPVAHPQPVKPRSRRAVRTGRRGRRQVPVTIAAE